jgi:hypothetical protein
MPAFAIETNFQLCLLSCNKAVLLGASKQEKWFSKTVKGPDASAGKGGGGKFFRREFMDS